MLSRSPGAQTSGITETKLDNGLTVLMKESHAAPVFTAQIWFKVGSRNEYNGITGISHMLEHMLFNSSKNYAKGEISKLIRERGGIENAATWTDFTYYWQLLSSDNLELSLKTLAERAGNALLLRDELQKERTVVLSELQGDENDPDTLLFDDVFAAAFKAHPYHWPTIGWESDVENINRDQLWDYYHTYYHPNNATLVLIGDFNPARALELIKKYFGPIPAHELPRPVYTVEPVQHGERDVVVRREGNAQRALIAYHTPSLTDPDTYPLMVLDQILSGGKSGRLYQSLVEAQLATSAWSSADSRRDPSLFELGATARQGVTADALEAALLKEVEKAKAAVPTTQEMQAAQNQLEANFIFQNDSVSEQGERLGYYNTVASWHYMQDLIPKIKAVKPEEVQAVAKKYLNQDNMTVGKFLPTDGQNGGSSPAGTGGGPIHDSLLPDASKGVCYLHMPSLKPKSKTTKPTAGGATSSSLAAPHRTVLPNGMVVIVQENPSNPTVSITGNLKAGSYFDKQGKHGAASLVADMISRGTAKRSALDLAREAESVGAEMNASASVESANFSAHSLSKDFPVMLDLLSDELMNASFPQDQIDRAKGEVVSDLEDTKESPEDTAMRAFYNSVFPDGHPYHKLTVEEAENEVKPITRDDLVSFYRSYYRPDTTIIVIVGDVKNADAVALVKQYFGGWKGSGATPKIDIPTVTPQKEVQENCHSDDGQEPGAGRVWLCVWAEAQGPRLLRRQDNEPDPRRGGSDGKRPGRRHSREAGTGLRRLLDL